MRRINKKGFEFSFAWIFALLFGGIIIFLAVYMAFNIVAGERKASDTSLAKGFDTLLYPVGTGLESSKVTQISFPVTTRVIFQCNSNGAFGEQIIKTSASSSLGDKYSNTPLGARSKDKYIFAESSVESKTFLTFIKPLEMPFEVADLIYFIPAKEKYCFMVSKNSNLGKELEDLKKNNPYFNKSIFVEGVDGCPENSKKICFNQGNRRDCYASVEGNKVTKGNEAVYFDGGETGNAFLYAAVFSDPSYYECQLKRLNKRASELTRLYLQKKQVSSSICGLSMNPKLEAYANLTRNFNSSQTSLSQIISLSREIGEENEDLSCLLF